MIRDIFNYKVISILSIILVLQLNTMSNAGMVICLDFEINSTSPSIVSSIPLSCQPSRNECCSELIIQDIHPSDLPGEDCSECMDLSFPPFDLACLSDQDSQHNSILIENDLFTSNSFKFFPLPGQKQLYLTNPPPLSVSPPTVLRTVILII